MKDLFSSSEQFQVFNYYRPDNKATAEKVLRTFGDKEHCESYVLKYTPEHLRKYINHPDPKERQYAAYQIEPYNADEWNRPKANGCCILPLEKFQEK